MYFVAATLELRPRGPQVLTVADAGYGHAAILHTLSAADATAGRTLHDMGRNKPMTFAFVQSQPQKTMLRLTFMDKEGLDYANIIISALSRQPTLRLGPIVCDVGTVDVNKTTWSGVSTWADLRSPTAARSMCFRFVTPTAITKRDDCGGRFTAVYPEPLDVFSGLARRWRALEGPALPDDLDHFLRTGGCVAANYRLETVEYRTSERIQIGFVGYMVYACRKHNPACITALNALARLAFFTGVGYQTARGMGATRTTLAR
jgi:CRISPR-associated endoribonuclease Cas6